MTFYQCLTTGFCLVFSLIYFLFINKMYEKKSNKKTFDSIQGVAGARASLRFNLSDSGTRYSEKNSFIRILISFCDWKISFAFVHFVYLLCKLLNFDRRIGLLQMPFLCVHWHCETTQLKVQLIYWHKSMFDWIVLIFIKIQDLYS